LKNIINRNPIVLLTIEIWISWVILSKEQKTITNPRNLEPGTERGIQFRYIGLYQTQ
jgi:hypothetical protein